MLFLRSVKLLQASAKTVHLKHSACKLINPPVVIYREFHKSAKYFRRMAPQKLNADERLEKLDPVLQTGNYAATMYMSLQSQFGISDL